jgi:hypothetical protein
MRTRRLVPIATVVLTSPLFVVGCGGQQPSTSAAASWSATVGVDSTTGRLFIAGVTSGMVQIVDPPA